MSIAGQFSSAQIRDFVWPEHFEAGDNPPAIQLFGETLSVGQLKGEIGYALTKDRVAQSGDGHETKTGFGDTVDSKPMSPESSSYTIPEKRQESFSIVAQERAQLEQVVGSDDPVDIANFVGAAIRYQIWVDYHRDVDGLLTDDTLNEKISASNPWDGGSGTPATNIHSALDKILGQADVAIAGMDAFRALQFSDTVREFAGVSIDGNDGVVEPAAVEGWLGKIFGITDLLVPELWFNQDNYKKVGLNPDRVFDATFWVGSSSAVRNVEQENDEPEAEVDEPSGAGKEIWYGTRTMEPHRVGDSRLGCFIDGVV